MEEIPIIAKARIQILKPIEEVFDAIVNPDRINKYFVAHSTGILKSNTTVQWKFPEFEEFYPIHCKDIIPNEKISFNWDPANPQMTVDIMLEQAGDATIVTVKEGNFSDHKDAVQQAIGQTEGWANFLVCLKAYLEYGINLRNGAFDFIRDNHSQ